ncbi:hypothetical protein Misp02_70410 [Microtetraspora sp. NBRC 16547]|nr:hypothetical protein Misp02_70410 [Microtetraspora sp. NBRC 16547]
MKKAFLTGILAAAAAITPVAVAAEAAMASTIPDGDIGSSLYTPGPGTVGVPSGGNVHEYILNGRTYTLPSCQYAVNGGVYVMPTCGASYRRPMYIVQGRSYVLPGDWCDQRISGLSGQLYGLDDYTIDERVIHQYVVGTRTYTLPSCQYVMNGGIYIMPTCGPSYRRPMYILNGRSYDLPGDWCDQRVGLPGSWYGLSGRGFGVSWGGFGLGGGFGVNWGGWGRPSWGGGGWGRPSWGGGSWGGGGWGGPRPTWPPHPTPTPSIPSIPSIPSTPGTGTPGTGTPGGGWGGPRPGTGTPGTGTPGGGWGGGTHGPGTPAGWGAPARMAGGR